MNSTQNASTNGLDRTARVRSAAATQWTSLRRPTRAARGYPDSHCPSHCVRAYLCISCVYLGSSRFTQEATRTQCFLILRLNGSVEVSNLFINVRCMYSSGKISNWRLLYVLGKLDW